MNSPGSDVNLMFGILALQMDFIDRDQLIEAMQAWLLDKSRTLGQILVDRGDLPPPLRDTIDQLVATRLPQSPSPATDPSELTVAFEGSKEPLRLQEASREHTRSHTPSGSRPSTNSGSRVVQQMAAPGADQCFGEPTTESGRFERLKLHEEGGLGTVWVANDRELDRKVAVKEMKERFADDEHSRRRFVLEAEITGGLEHPGVVPVYGFGRYRDGRPFYAMRFIRGTSLRDAIQQFHQTDWRHATGTETREIAMRRLLTRFLDVCNTIYYAHRRGILHRDIKPSNIMLGEYGETLVVDWGLAKTVGRFEEPSDSSLPSESTLMPSASDKVTDTVLGHAIGSPPYMSPEQAAGEQEHLGPSTDIYSLGSTLYTMLTNVRPFEGESTDEILNKVRAGVVRRPRDIKPNTPKPLESICLKAMALRPVDRYPTVRHLVRDLEQFLANEPISAYRESFIDRFQRISRRHRSLFITGVASLILISLISTGASLIINQWRVRAETSATKADELATRESKAREAAIARQREAVLAMQRSDRVRNYLADVLRSPDPERDGRDVTVVELLDSQVGQLRDSFGDDDVVRAQLLGVLGETYYSLGRLQRSIELSRQSFELYIANLGPADPNTLRAQRQWIVSSVAAGRAEDVLESAKDNNKQSARVFGRDSAESLQARQVLAECYLGTGQTDKAVELLESVYQTTRQQVGDTKRPTMVAATSLMSAYVANERYEDAAELGGEAVAIQRLVLGVEHPLALRSMTVLATALQLTGRVDQAIEMLEATLEGKTRILGSEHAETLQCEFALVLAYIDAGREADAKRHLQLLRRQISNPDSFGSDRMLAQKIALLGVLSDADLLSVLKGRKDVVQTLSSLSSAAPNIFLKSLGWVMGEGVFKFFASDTAKRLRLSRKFAVCGATLSPGRRNNKASRSHRKHFLITLLPRSVRNTSGTITLPSACW